MKISIIGAGNVGSLAGLRIAQDSSGDVVLVDVLKGSACGKSFDLEDARAILKADYNIKGTDNIEEIKDSDIVVITAGLARRPGMTREELLAKNARIVQDTCLKIKALSPKAIVIVVTNPLDLMTRLALKVTGFPANRVFGMGVSLDASRFANLLSKELNVPCSEIEAVVVGAHGQAMIPLPRFTKVRGKPIFELLSQKQIDELTEKTVNRGAEIVSLLGSGSAYFAPSAAIAEIVGVVAKNKKKTIGICASLSGEYGLRDICIGVPCVLGASGVEKIVELELNSIEKEKFLKSAESIRQLVSEFKI